MRSLRIFIPVFLLCLSAGLHLRAQAPSATDTIPLNIFVNGTDTIPWALLPPVEIIDKLPKRFRKRYEEWTRLRNAVYVTYPYAKIAAGVLKDVDAHLASIPERKRKAYLRKKEDELKARFGGKLEDLSVYQGKVLIKLIYRQTGTNCYDIIREMRGGFSARFWQTVAFFFGSNLKSDYNKQQDADIEAIVQEIENDPYYYWRYHGYN